MKKNEFSSGLQPAPYDIYCDTRDYRTLTTSLRKVSVDHTPVPGKYVSFYNNVVDMIDSDGTVVNIEYDAETHSLIITYDNGNKQVIPLNDNDIYLDDVEYDTTTGDIKFDMNNGDEMTLNLKSNFYDKKDINNIQKEITEYVDDKHKWLTF